MLPSNTDSLNVLRPSRFSGPAEWGESATYRWSKWRIVFEIDGCRCTEKWLCCSDNGKPLHWLTVELGLNHVEITRPHDPMAAAVRAAAFLRGEADRG